MTRGPRGPRPCWRTIAVLVPVSSMKTSLLGSSEGWLWRQALRACATSSRSCSAACSIFFKADLPAGEKAPHRAVADHNGFVGTQTLLDLAQRQVRLLFDQ